MAIASTPDQATDTTTATATAPEPLATPRRTVLGASLGGLAALAATALGRPAPVNAAAGQAVVQGQVNNAGATATTVTSTKAGDGALVGSNTNGTGRGVYGKATATSGINVGVFGTTASGSGRGVFGKATKSTGTAQGVRGEVVSPNGFGVYGKAATTAGTGAAVRADGGVNRAIRATTSGFDTPAIHASSVNADFNLAGLFEASGFGTGVRGTSVDGNGVSGRSVTENAIEGSSTGGAGVSGSSISDAGVRGDGAIGVRGDSDIVGVRGNTSAGAGIGVQGMSVSGTSVDAVTTSGVAVWAKADSGTAILAESQSGDAIAANAPDGKYAGNFTGSLLLNTSFLDMTERATPAAPPADTARLFVRDSGTKTQLCVIFPGGNVVVLGTSV